MADVTGGAPALELRGVTRSFAGRPVLRGLDLVVPRGQVVALLGPSGAGKTTLLRVLTGLLPPDTGVVRVLGQDLASLPSRQRRRFRQHVGLLYQNDALVPGLRAVHNVLIGRLGRWSLLKSLLSLAWPRDVEAAAAAMRAVQLEDRLYAPHRRAVRRPASARGDRPPPRAGPRDHPGRRAGGLPRSAAGAQGGGAARAALPGTREDAAWSPSTTWTSSRTSSTASWP